MQNQSWHRRAKISHVSVLTFEASGCRGGRKSGQRARSSDRLCQSTTRGLGCLLLPKREATLWRSWQDDYTDCRRRHLELEWYISISWYDPITVTLVSAFQCTDYIIDNEAFSLTSVSAQKKKKSINVSRHHHLNFKCWIFQVCEKSPQKHFTDAGTGPQNPIVQCFWANSFREATECHS